MDEYNYNLESTVRMYQQAPMFGFLLSHLISCAECIVNCFVFSCAKLLMILSNCCRIIVLNILLVV